MKFVKLQCLVIDKSHELLFLEYRSLIYHQIQGKSLHYCPILMVWTFSSVWSERTISSSSFISPQTRSNRSSEICQQQNNEYCEYQLTGWKTQEKLIRGGGSITLNEALHCVVSRSRLWCTISDTWRVSTTNPQRSCALITSATFKKDLCLAASSKYRRSTNRPDAIGHRQVCQKKGIIQEGPWVSSEIRLV